MEALHEEFSALKLHDASLQSIAFDWKSAQCQLELQCWSVELGRVQLIRLGFFKVSDLKVPKREPWGNSVSILEQCFEQGIYRIQMQSGDCIEITAQECRQVCY